MSIRPTFFGIEIARTGLNVSQKGLDVTGHNIANVDTAGYTRQRLVNTAYEPYSAVTQFKPVENGLVGSGAHVMILDQIRDQFLDRQYRTEVTEHAYWQARTQGLNYVEAQFEGSATVSLSQGIVDLFKAFNTETTEANDRGQRVLIQQQGINLAKNFNLAYERLCELQENQNTSVQVLTDRINTIAEGLAKLNKSIYSYEIDGQPANDLRDKRNLLIDELSGYVDIKYYEDADGKFVVTIGNTPAAPGNELVNHTTINKLECQSVPNSVKEFASDTTKNVHEVHWAGGAALDIKGGELKAHIDLRDNATNDTPGIPYFIEQLNNMVRALAQEVNAVHKQGYTHAASTLGSVQGINFFDVPAGGVSAITAGSFKVSDEIKASEYNIAASDVKINLTSPDPDELQAGNQVNAKAIYDVINRADIVLTGPPPVSIGGLDGFMTGILLDVAVTLGNSKSMQSVQNQNVLAADTARTSISGVSLDEEMTNMIRYQHAFAGASRVVTSMDEALDVIINRMGLVGRS